jgi:glycosyltransferase involved in cell wall biosynthesis
MRVAHIVRTFLPTSQTFIHTQLRAQRDLDQAVFTRKRENELDFPFDPVYIVPGPRQSGAIMRRLPLGSRRASRRLTAALRAYQPDVIHAHFAWTAGYALSTVRELALPLIAAFHGRDVYSPATSVPHFMQVYPSLFNTGTAFTCVGPTARTELQRLGCPASRLRVVPVGIDLEDFPFAPAPAKRPLILLQVGRLVPKKGADTTIAAYALARSRLGASELWIVGDGPERRSLEQQARTSGLSDHVRFWGALPPAEVRQLMGRSHLGVQPSRVAPDGDREGTPTTIIEMQARGVAVAATRHTDIPFVVPFPERLVAETDATALADELVRLSDMSSIDRTGYLSAARALVERQHDARQIQSQLQALYAECLTRYPSN